MWGLAACCQLRQQITLQHPEPQRQLERICKLHIRAVVLESGLLARHLVVVLTRTCLGLIVFSLRLVSVRVFWLRHVSVLNEFGFRLILVLFVIWVRLVSVWWVSQLGLNHSPECVLATIAPNSKYWIFVEIFSMKVGRFKDFEFLQWAAFASCFYQF